MRSVSQMEAVWQFALAGMQILLLQTGRRGMELSERFLVNIRFVMHLMSIPNYLLA